MYKCILCACLCKYTCVCVRICRCVYKLCIGVLVFVCLYLCIPMCMCIYACEFVYVYVYLRRQQERDLMQKARLLTDEISVSFQMFLILLYSIALCSESQIPVFKEGQSNT